MQKLDEMDEMDDADEASTVHGSIASSPRPPAQVTFRFASSLILFRLSGNLEAVTRSSCRQQRHVSSIHSAAPPALSAMLALRS